MSATRPVRWLILLALLLAPLAMIGGGPAMAHARPAAAGHCADSDRPDEAPAVPVDCMVACAGCLPTQASPSQALPPLTAKAGSGRRAFTLLGLHPEAETPPPRVS